MPNLEIPKLNIHPEPTPEQMQNILKEEARLEKTLLEIKNEIGKGKFKLQDNGLYSMGHSGLVDQNNNPIDSKTLPESKIIIPESQIIIPESKIIIPESKIIDPATDPMMQIVDPQGNPVSSKIEKPPVEEVAEETVGETEPEEEEEVVEEAPAIVMEPAPEPTPTPKQPDTEPVAVKTQAQILAEKIRNSDKTGEILTTEEYKYRSEHWPEVEAALIGLAKKPEPQNIIATTEKTTADRKSEMLGKFKEDKATQAVEKETPENKVRIEKAKKKIASKKKGDGVHWLYYAGMVPASPTALGVWAGGKLHEGVQDSIAMLKKKFNQAMNPEKKKTDLKEKFGNKKPNEKKDEAVPGEAMQKTQEQIDKEKKLKEVADRKNGFLEKAFGEKMKDPDIKAWDKLKGLSIKSFFNPTRIKKDIKDYEPWQKAIYDQLKPLYDKKPVEVKETMTIGDYINSLAEQDKLKDLWNQTSSSNS